MFARHARHAAATRAAVAAWGLKVLCQDPDAYSNVLTAVLMPKGNDADRLRKLVLERYDMSLGAGLSKVKGRVFRIGDKVTQLRNNYDKGAAGVFNGTTGVVTGLSLEDHALTVRTDEDEEISYDFDELDEALRTGASIAQVDGDTDAFIIEMPRDAAYVEAVIACQSG